MKTLESMIIQKHENVVFCYDKESGLKAIIAIHDTTLGPAVGGTRFWNYETEEEAIYDALRLAKGMTYKNAACGLNAGGGKGVIIGDPKKDKTPELLKAYGRFVNRLGGAYYTAEDMNISEEDVEYIKSETDYVVGVKDISGNPSPSTALGVFQGIKATAKELFGSDDLTNKTIAISGIGAVGYPLAQHLHNAGAKLIVADIFEEKLEQAKKEFNAQVVSIDEIQFVECDIFAPCARGALFSVDNVNKLKCKAIAGSANNVLVDDEAGEKLHELGILYIPDFIINAGGVINCGYEIEEGGWEKEKVEKIILGIYETVNMILEKSKKENISPSKAANLYAEEIIAAGKRK